MNGSFFGQSSFATHAIVAARNAVKVPKGVPVEIVGPLGCGIQTGVGTVLNSLDVPAGSSINVSGAGAVGLSAIMAAKVAGATRIIALDVLDERLAFATQLGATHTVNGRTEDVVARIMEITGGQGAAIALVGVVKSDAQISLGLVSGAGKSFISAIEGDAVPQVFIPPRPVPGRAIPVRPADHHLPVRTDRAGDRRHRQRGCGQGRPEDVLTGTSGSRSIGTPAFRTGAAGQRFQTAVGRGRCGGPDRRSTKTAPNTVKRVITPAATNAP